MHGDRTAGEFERGERLIKSYNVLLIRKIANEFSSKGTIKTL